MLWCTYVVGLSRGEQQDSRIEQQCYAFAIS